MLSWYIDCTDGIAVRSTVSQINYRLASEVPTYIFYKNMISKDAGIIRVKGGEESRPF